MKFDKESMMKNQFWLLLAAAMPMAIVAIFILLTVVSAEIARNRKDLEAKLGATKSSGSAKNQEWVNAMQNVANKADALKEVVWRKAYEDQKLISTWPLGGQDREGERLLVGMDELFRDGLFALEVKVEKGQAAPADAPKTDAPKAAQTPKAPAAPEADKKDDDANKEEADKAEAARKEDDKKVVKEFQGVIVQKKRDWLQVKGSTETKTFYKSGNTKVDGTELKSWVDLSLGDRVEVTYVRGRYFNDPLTATERDVYTSDEGYKTQLHEILQMVDPVTTKGEGVVILRDWPYNKDELPSPTAKFFHYVEWKETKKDISEEAWMAQEDLWIQREVYRLVRLANDYVSKFERKSGKPGDRAGLFENPYWKLKLEINGTKLTATVTNKLTQKQKLDVLFKVRLRENADPVLLEVPGDPLNPGQSSNPSTLKDEVSGKDGIYDVEQVINWETAAVKRIDQISIGTIQGDDCCHAHRTFPDGLKPFKKVDAAAAAPAAAAGPMGGANPMALGMGPGAGGKFGTQQNAQKLTPNGLSEERYLEVTPQARRLPIGVALIVDQDHVDRVLTAFANSKLRFLTTQVIINRYPQSLRPDDSIRQPGGLAGPFATPMFRPPAFGSKSITGPMAPRVRPSSDFGAQSAGGASDDQETNVEMVIYGIVSLYERFPPLPTDRRKAPGS